MSIDELWAKSPKGKSKQGESLLEHSIQTAQISQSVLAKLPLSIETRAQIEKTIFLCCALHDVGKAARGFQNSLRPAGGIWGRRHEILSTAVAAQICPELNVAGLFAILTHHKSIPADNETTERCLPPEQLPFEETNVWTEMVNDLKANSIPLVEYLKELSNELGIEWNLDRFDGNVSGVGVSKFFLNRTYQREAALRCGEDLRWISLMRGLLITSDHLASAGEEYIPSVPVLSDQVPNIRNIELGEKKILPFQERCGTLNGSGILKAPTGSGKTLAMLLWATENQETNGRLFYTLPYTASINAMYKRLSKMFPQDSVGILHHKNAAFLFRIYESEHSTKAHEFAKSLASLARELYFPIKVLTPHQILRVALRGKGWELGLAEFPNACFIFDEIHAYDPLIVGLIVASAKWLQLMGAKILVASATMPSFLEKIFRDELQIPECNIVEPDPTNEKDKIVRDKKRHKVQVIEGSLISNLENIINDIRCNPTKKVLIVCNYVATSQEVCKELSKQGIQDFVLLHARFNSQDRYCIEEGITSKNPPRVLVATQAVEVSLDIDYDCGYTEPAPIDALAQRFGRVNRKGEREPALVTVYEQQSVDTARPIYDPKLVHDTVDLLKMQGVLSEDNLVEILNSVYRDGYCGDLLERYERGLHHPSIENFDENIIAGTYNDWIEEIIEKTDGQIEVLPFKAIDENGVERSLYDEFVSLQRKHEYLGARMLLVPIRVTQFFVAKQKGTIRRDSRIDEWVTTLMYSSKLGLDLKNQFESIL